MTEKNIEESKPFEIYAYGNELLSFCFLFINNITVSLKEFAGGILLGIPTVTGLLYNAVMVGAFEYLFYTHGMVSDSLLTILIHGTLELFSIVVAATSGLVLATSWLFPGSRSRLSALKRGAKDGLIIALSGFPMLLVAAFFEGFVTRHTDMPLWMKLLIITTSLVLIVGYFIIYPIRLQRSIKTGKSTEGI